MNCPKCRTPNEDGAKSCSLCHEFFEVKWPAPKFLVVPTASAHLQGWTFTGPMVAGQEALYFFFKRAEYEVPGRFRLPALIVGQAGGLLGGLAADKAVEAALHGTARPENLRFGFRDDGGLITVHCAGRAPELTYCREFIEIPLPDVRAVWMEKDGDLLVRGPGYTLEVTGDLKKDAVMGHLKAWRYPVKPFAYERPRWARRFALLLLAAGAAASIADFYELQKAVEWLGDVGFVRRFLFDSQGYLRVRFMWAAFVMGTVGCAYAILGARYRGD